MQVLTGGRKRNVKTIDQAMGLVERPDFFVTESASFESDGIHAPDFHRRSFDEHVGRNVGWDATHAADEAIAADGGELVDSDGAGDAGVIVDVNVPGDHRVVSDHDVVSETDVVPRCTPHMRKLFDPMVVTPVSFVVAR